MKAIVQDRYGSPDGLVLREIDRPELAEDRVLVQVRGASLNAYDWGMMYWFAPVMMRLLRGPTTRVGGRDLAGVVDAVGAKVTRFKPGDEVFGVGNGSFAEYAIASEEGLAPKPRNLTFAQAAALPIAGLTALQGLREKVQVSAGQRVLVYGAGGGVGTFAVQIAKALGAHVTAVTSPKHLDTMRAIGADAVLDYTREDFTRGAGRYDVVFDLGGNLPLTDCERVLTPTGKLVMCGAGSRILPMLSRLLKARLMWRTRNRRVFFVARVRHADLVALKDLVEAGKVTPVIERQYPLSGVPEAMRRQGTRQVGGKLVVSVAGP